MKKLAFFTFAFACLMLFSFIRPDKGIKKIGNNLWEVTTTAEMAADDQTRLKELIQKEYDLKDFKTERTLEYKNQAGRWWVITNKKWCTNFFTEKAIAGESRDPKRISASQQEIADILQKYTPKKTK